MVGGCVGGVGGGGAFSQFLGGRGKDFLDILSSFLSCCPYVLTPDTIYTTGHSLDIPFLAFLHPFFLVVLRVALLGSPNTVIAIQTSRGKAVSSTVPRARGISLWRVGSTRRTRVSSSSVTRNREAGALTRSGPPIHFLHPQKKPVSSSSETVYV
jgi:hypothetical protein